MSVEIESLDAGQLDKWHDFLNGCPGATFYHSAPFQEHNRAKCERPVYLLFRRKGKYVGGLPGGICKTEKGIELRSPFSASFAGLLFPEPPAVTSCLEVLRSLRAWCVGQALSSVRVEQTPDCYGQHYGGLLEYCFRVEGYDLSHYDLSHALHLAKDPLTRFSEAARRNYRRGYAAGLSVEPSKDLTASYALIRGHLDKLGGGASLDEDEYLAMTSLMGDRIWTLSVYHEGTEVAAGVFYALSAKCLLLFWWAHKEEAQQLRPVNFLAHEVARRAYSQGFEYFDLGTTSADTVLREGLARFKESLGGIGFLRKKFALALSP
jgi:hypothetical protein